MSQKFGILCPKGSPPWAGVLPNILWFYPIQTGGESAPSEISRFLSYENYLDFYDFV